MDIGTEVEYETGICASGIGEVISFDEDTELVTIIDHDDGSVWRGPVERATPLEQ